MGGEASQRAEDSPILYAAASPDSDRADRGFALVKLGRGCRKLFVVLAIVLVTLVEPFFVAEFVVEIK